MDKVIRDGKVAVLYSPRFGSGWSTWSAPMEAIFHPKIVELVLQDERDKITEALITELFGENVIFSSVVKGNAYGHGIDVFVPLYIVCGCIKRYHTAICQAGSNCIDVCTCRICSSTIIFHSTHCAVFSN